MSSLTSSPEPRARPVLGFLPRGVGFWLLAVVLGLLVFASSAPSPLYGVYQQKWQFSATTLTAIFGVYARVRGRGGHQRAERGTDRPAATGQHPRTGREQLHPWVWIGTWSAGHQRAGRVRPRADPPDLVAAAGRVRAGHPGGSRGTRVGGAVIRVRCVRCARGLESLARAAVPSSQGCRGWSPCGRLVVSICRSARRWRDRSRGHETCSGAES